MKKMSKTVKGAILGALILGGLTVIASIVGPCRQREAESLVKTGNQIDSSPILAGDINNPSTSIIKIGEQHGGFMFNINPANLTIINNNVTETETKKTITYFEKKLEDMNSVVTFTHQELERLTIALRDLDQRTSDIEKLPDGRTRFGTIIAGKANIVMEAHNLALEYYDANNLVKAFENSKFAIQLYEKSQQETMGVLFSKNGLTNSGAAVLYSLGAMSAHRLNANKEAFEWAEKANRYESSPNRIYMLAVTLYNINRHEEALEAIDDGLKKYPNDPNLEKVKTDIINLSKK